MTIRLQCDIDNTTELLAAILTQTRHGHRVMFLASAGRGKDVIQRVRVKLSRLRMEREAKNKKRRHFRLHHDVYPYTEKGIRHDCVVVWESRTQRHLISETLDDMLGNGDLI